MNDYKRKFVNMETFFYLMAFDTIPIQDGVSRVA
jgi:hypothetical protein